jgi:hypothetical protein
MPKLDATQVACVMSVVNVKTEGKKEMEEAGRLFFGNLCYVSLLVAPLCVSVAERYQRDLGFLLWMRGGRG